MRSVFVVIGPPFIDPVAGIGHGQEPGSIQALLTDPAVERLDIGVICGFSGPREVQFDLVQICPLIE